jgi:hypothetical protein
MRQIAEAYVRLVLAVGRHDPAYVDAYYGPAEWRNDVEQRVASLLELSDDAQRIIEQVRLVNPAGADDDARRTFLGGQLRAVEARIAQLAGHTLTFDEESAAFYDAVAPTRPESYFQATLDELDALLPGGGPIIERLDRFRAAFIVPPARLADVFERAIDECRRHTRERISLPDDESFTVEYVTDKPWSGYNWYKGGHRSVIQVNTDLPIYIDRAIDLAAHEGYPAARAADGGGARLGRVHGLPALLAGVSHRGRDRELRHRGGVPGRFARQVRSRCADADGRSARGGRRPL